MIFRQPNLLWIGPARNGWAVVACSLFAICAQVGNAWAQIGVDRIQLRNGVESGTITDVNALGVTLTKGGVARKIPAEEISAVTFAEEPPDLSAARRSMARLRFDSAQKTLERVNTQQLERTEIKQEYEFLVAACEGHLALAGTGDARRAAATVGVFTKQNRTSYHVPEALELQGDLLLAAGDEAAARKKYETLAKAPRTYYKMRSAILVARLLQESGDNAAALEQFSAALKLYDGTAVTKDLERTAQLGQAVNLAASDQMGEAKSKFRQLASQLGADDKTALAATYNALGDAFRLAGDPRAARDAYLHVELLFPDENEARAESLARLATLWKELRQPTRAEAARAELADEYPGSRWRNR